MELYGKMSYVLSFRRSHRRCEIFMLSFQQTSSSTLALNSSSMEHVQNNTLALIQKCGVAGLKCF